MEFRTVGCNNSLVRELYREVFVEEKGWPAEELIKRKDGHDFALFYAGKVVGGMRVTLKSEATQTLFFEQEFYSIPDNSAEISILVLKKKFRGRGGLKFLFRELYRFVQETQIFDYYAVIDPGVNKVFSLFGFEMDELKAKMVWGEMCYPGSINIDRAMRTLFQNSPKLYQFLSS